MDAITLPWLLAIIIQRAGEQNWVSLNIKSLPISFISLSVAADLTPVPKSGMVATVSSDLSLALGLLHAPEYAVDGLVDQGHQFHHSHNTFPYQWLQVTFPATHATFLCKMVNTTVAPFREKKIATILLSTVLTIVVPRDRYSINILILFKTSCNDFFL